MKYSNVVILSTADWDNPFWTNKQHVAVSLAKCGFRVLYIDSLGLRRPGLHSRDVSRALRRLRRALELPRRVDERIWVWSPLIVPFQNWRLFRALNRIVLRRGLRRNLKRLEMEKQLLWTYSPMTTEFFDISEFACTVYHCVDEIKSQPDMPKSAIESAERTLTQQASIVFTTSPALTESRRHWNAATYYLPHVADQDHFSRALSDATRIPADLEEIPRPRIGFVGAISAYKIDFELLRVLARSRRQWSIVLIGAVGEGDPSTDASCLEIEPNIHLIGPRSYEDVPAYLKGIDVAILPNRINEYTRAMFPMKFFEYLAAGRPVVSVELDALSEFREVVDLAADYGEFVAAVDRALAGDCASLELRLSVAGRHTYITRTRTMLDLVNAASS